MTNSESAKSRDLRSKIESWLQGEYEKVQPYPTADRMAWAYTATLPNGRILLVGCPLATESHIQISSGLTVGDNHSARFKALPKEQRVAYLYDTAVQLLSLDVLYEGLADPPQEIWIHSKCYIEGLTRDVFLQRALKVGNVVMLLYLRLQRLIGEVFDRGSSFQEEEIN